MNRNRPLWARLGAALSLSAVFWMSLADAQEMGNTLATNQSLKKDQLLRSLNKQYRAVMQSDGNFVVYGEPARAVWAAGSNPKASNGSVTMQSDGNLCVNVPPTYGIWCSYSNGAAGDYFTMLRDNGDLEVYRGTVANTAAAVLVWTSALDAGYYSSKYADLKNAFGTDARKLMVHWLQYGRYEGRSPRNGISDDGRTNAIKVNLDLVFYANKYPDLKNMYGFDAQALYVHWMGAGRSEGRVPNKATDDFLAPPPRSANDMDVMRVGDWLEGGQTMWSIDEKKDKRYRLDLQPNGQLVIYERAVNPGAHRWSQPISLPTNQKYIAYLQDDGHICTYKIVPGKPNENVICSPGPAGGSKGRYFATIQSDGNLAIYKGGGPNDNRGWVWDRITTRAPANDILSAAFEQVKTFTVSTANTVAAGTAGAANTVASTGTAAANSLAKEATAAANVVAREVTNAANVVVRETVSTANKVANTTQTIAVDVGRKVEQQGVIIGNEIVKNGEIVGYAVANLAVDAWNKLKGSCGVIGRRVFPIDGYFQGAKQITGAMTTYSPLLNKNDAAAVNAVAGQANACFESVQDGFYCAFPKELEKLVTQAGAMPGNMVNLATRVFNEAKTTDCLIAGGATIGFGATGLEVCALGKVVVADAQKAFKCFSAAEAKGVMKKLFPANAGNAASFPSKASCEGIGELAFSVAKTVVTQGFSAEAKAAKAAGKSDALVVVADELRTLYKIASAAASYDKITAELYQLPECK